MLPNAPPNTLALYEESIADAKSTPAGLRESARVVSNEHGQNSHRPGLQFH